MQLLSACIKYYNESPRVRMFARFLNIVEPLGTQDLKVYFDVVEYCFKTILNFQIHDSTENPQIPIVSVQFTNNLGSSLRLLQACFPTKAQSKRPHEAFRQGIDTLKTFRLRRDETRVFNWHLESSLPRFVL